MNAYTSVIHCQPLPLQTNLSTTAMDDTMTIICLCQQIFIELKRVNFQHQSSIYQQFRIYTALRTMRARLLSATSHSELRKTLYQYLRHYGTLHRYKDKKKLLRKKKMRSLCTTCISRLQNTAYCCQQHKRTQGFTHSAPVFLSDFNKIFIFLENFL